MEFVDKVDEIARLKKAFTRKEPGFFVLYGRRRLGKSTLLNRVLKDNDIYFMADKSDQTQQRALLAKTIALHIPDFDRVPYPDWETLFVELNHRTKNNMIILNCVINNFEYSPIFITFASIIKTSSR
jgi:AAA+ ATPase superfamily predicted ATPase